MTGLGDLKGSLTQANRARAGMGELEEARDRSLAQALSLAFPLPSHAGPQEHSSHYYLKCDQLTPGFSLPHFLRNMLSSDSHRALSLTSLQGFLSESESLWTQGADSPAGSAAVTYISSPLGPGCGG